ncbi:MAG: tetratricopeptide repeat protein [Ardenticatenales bacterium]|nr:tetratricopeptide repeat protein [Ardenticatenales bacterium]
MSRKQEAMAAVRTNPKSSKAWSDLGDVLAAEGQLEKAKESYLRAIQLDPSNEAAQEGMFSASMAQAQTEPAPEPPPQRSAPPPTPPAARETPPPASSSKGGAKASDSVAAKESRERREAAARPTPTPPPASMGAGSGKSTINLRKRPPHPKKPGQARIIAGIVGVLLLPTLCACSLVFYVLSLAFGGGS